MTTGSEGLLCVRPEDVVLAVPWNAEGALAGNRFPGRVTAVVPQGPLNKVTIDCGVRLVAAVSGHVARELDVKAGSALTVALRPVDLYVIPKG
jgi:ABC-type molybdate transport system ATPase subunit